MPIITAHAPSLAIETTINVASIGANAELTHSLTNAAAIPGQMYQAQMPSLENGVLIKSVHCATRGTISIVFRNFTGGAIDPAAQLIRIIAL